MIAVLRGGVVENPKYAGRRLFSAGINLTRLYQGQISYLFYIRHILGFENKWLRGLARPDFPPDERVGQTIEKPWIAALDGFAIGGGCQHLLVMDYILAGADAYMTLPARKEGIIPGASNMRLPRFTGDRIARQAVMYERRLDCDSAEGRLICDEIAAPEEMDTALARVIDGLTSSGVVSAVANRRAFRVQQEPIDLFLNYVSVYAREQAYCHFSPALIANLERHWNAQNRKA
jgi:thioesterase DpgC